MIVADANFRPNPDRAIYVQGLIDQQLVDRLTPQIVSLLGANREPITVYIDSRGGSVFYADVIRRLLSASNQDHAEPCRIITVVTSRAASAAADLLSAGHYALAFPGATVLYHGVRTSLNDPLTVELTSSLAENLKMSNDRHAMALVRESEWRFMFRFVSMRSQFVEFRERSKPKELADLDCFIGLISENLSERAKNVIQQAENRFQMYNALLKRVLAVAGRRKAFTHGGTTAEVEGAILKAIVDFEISNNKKDPSWAFSEGGLSRLHDDFFLLREYVEGSQSDQFKIMCKRWGTFVLSEEEKKEIESLPEAERPEKMFEMTQFHFRPLWSFFVALCHALQEGENELTATDVFWLGLIDEVVGEKGLPSLRLIREFRKDAETDRVETSSGKAAAAPA